MEVEVVGRRPNDAIWARDALHRCRDMIIEAAVLVINNHEQDFVPLWTRSQRFVHLFHELLPLSNVVGRVIVVAGQMRQLEVPLLNHRVVRQLPLLRMSLEMQVELMEMFQVLRFSEVPGEGETQFELALELQI